MTPTVTVTGTVVHEWNYYTVATRLHSECARSALNFLFSARLCDALDTCYDHWHGKYTGKPKPKGLWKPWRSVANRAMVEKKEKTNPADNNYDGRNFITE